MLIFFYALHALVCIALIAGVLVHSTKSDGLGALGGQTEGTYRNQPRGAEAILDRFMTYFAWGFLGVAFLSSVIVPAFF